MDHFLDVARIASMIAADEGIEADRELIYAAALLHDIGRVSQYENGTRHEEAGAQLAPDILSACGFSAKEAAEVTAAIAGHGDEGVKVRRDLTGLIYRADKLSRKCYTCGVRDRCHKSAEKLIMEIIY